MAVSLESRIPVFLKDAMKFTLPSNELFTLAMQYDEKSIATLLDSGAYVKTSISGMAYPMRRDSEKNFRNIANGMEDNDLIAVIGIPMDAYNGMLSHIENQLPLLKCQHEGERLDELLSSKYKWHYVIDRLLLYQGRRVIPRNVKGYFSLSTGQITMNRLFSPNDMYWPA